MSSQLANVTRQLLPKSTKESIKCIFERQPGHDLEKIWSLYVDTESLVSMIIAQKKLPVVRLVDASMFWQSELAPDNQADLSQVNLGHYNVLVILGVSVGDTKCDACIFSCENEEIGECTHFLRFYHKAPAPVLPWPDCSASVIELPPDFISAVNCGLQQAQESLLHHISTNYPTITEMIA
jgi:hypothetical protein